MDDLLAADRRFVAALAARSPDAMTLIDDDVTWVDAKGARFGRNDTLPASPLGNEDGLVPLVERYAETATVMTNRDKMFVLRIWAKRASGWRLIVWHEVSQQNPPSGHAPGRADWDNPCRTLPYTPRTSDERECLASWQELETAVMGHDPDAWARHVAEEFIVVGSARRHNKADRYAVIAEQRMNNTPSAPAPLVEARLDGFGDTMLMRCEHQPFHGKAAYVSRLFVKRQAVWLMAASFQTTRQDAPVKTI
jgi:hypothetical protein